METINIPDELVVRMQKYVHEGRFKDINDFLVQAINLLLYAEDNKNEFKKIVSQK